MKVSIIVPVYNVSKYLRRCLDSIVSQTFNDIEIILVNDGSTDNSLDICCEYAKNNPKITIINKENGGLVSARKAGFEISKGDYILNLDSDDWIEPDHIANLYNCAILSDADIVSSNIIKEYEDGTTEIYDNRPVSDDIENIIKQYHDNSVHTSLCTRLFKRTLFFIEGFHFPLYDYNEDLHQVTFMTVYAKRIVHIDKATYHYRINSNSITQQNGANSEINHYVQFVKNMMDLLVTFKNSTNDYVSQYIYSNINERKRGMIILSIPEYKKVKEALRFMQDSYRVKDIRTCKDVIFYLASRFRFIIPYYLRYIMGLSRHH